MLKIKFIFCISLIIFIHYRVFSQSFNPEDIPVEEKYPVKAVSEGEDFYLNVPCYVKYNKYDRNLYVVDQKNNNIRVFDTDLNYLRTIGRFGQGPGEFKFPADVTFDKKGNLYVIDQGNFRIQILDKDGEYISGFWFIYDISKPDICLDSKNRIYINKPANGYLFTLLDSTGNTITKFGELYRFENERELIKMNTVKFLIDDMDNIYCAFQEYPVLRKYDKDFNLIYEIKYDYLPEIKAKNKKWKKKISETKNQNTNIYKIYNMNISTDGEFLYLGLYLMDSNPVYKIGANTGEIIKKYILKYKEKETGYIFHVESFLKGFIFSIDYQYSRLLKFKI